MPTRAEISDISTAVRERADAVMLSGETTTGLYPLECVEVMKNILKTIEPTEVRGMNEVIELNEPKAKMLRSAAVLAQELGIPASSSSPAAGSSPTRWRRCARWACRFTRSPMTKRCSASCCCPGASSRS